jgi:probable rRNA maturation factor
MLSVPVLDEISYENLSSERATELCAAALFELGFDLNLIGEISVALVDANVIHELNLKYRDKDSPTDVLSFGIDGPYGDMVGEIVISPANADPSMGVEELVVHGTLHLVGMDHGEDFGASEMARVQRSVMETVRDPER